MPIKILKPNCWQGRIPEEEIDSLDLQRLKVLLSPPGAGVCVGSLVPYGVVGLGLGFRVL